MKWSAAGLFVAFMAFASQLIFLPTRSATRPSRPTSVSAAPYWKLPLAGVPPLQAPSQSRWWPLDRGRVFAGQRHQQRRRILAVVEYFARAKDAHIPVAKSD